MTKNKKLLSVFLVFGLVAAIAPTPLAAYAWEGGSEGNSENANSSGVQGTSDGKTDVEGWIGTFDGGEDPNRPDPPAESWVNVKIPTTALFGSLSSDAGAVYSPVYRIYNHSARGVTVEPTGFTKVSEPLELAGMVLNLNFTHPNSLTVPLRSADDAFLGAGLTSPGSITLGAGSESSPQTAAFTMSGQLPEGFNYPSNAPHQPRYGLVFSFTAEPPAAVQ
ncbi:hypothetical protein [Gordonibacter massiliensis (ex Traore et al. 2017)]|uniref:hypothetical protein n=1 Tax=Gordonibacter massiliensis (ex Traore et al. 2017) TaxID=1841863 RepID=UPI001C8C3FF1|nr:hypothetical protein [Gordonibacter massiliensis (ex Traore et al. 2017)]MBX9034685.1 hypothetical protein [Gordonibacter massiliensis (ex Traore et al. 2017)]